MRYKELIRYIIISTIGVVVATMLGKRYHQYSYLLIVVLGIIFIGYHCVNTLRRYRDISELSNYLYRIATGEYALDVRDYKEGELSVLKSEIYKLTLRLVEQNELLLKDKSYLLDALSDITHQLKTPLTSMSVMADLLSDENIVEEKRQEFLKNIHTEVERMRWLVVSLLKMSKLDAKAVELKKELVNVDDLIKHVLDSFLIVAELKEITISVEEDEQVWFIGDKEWVQEAISNLIKNSLEHTLPSGRLSIRYVQNNLYTQIVIQDSGEGISSEDLPHIFERFYKGKNATNGSIGIGLALAKQIIVSSNGSIHVISEEGKGTKFIVKLYKVTNLSPNMSSESHLDGLR